MALKMIRRRTVVLLAVATAVFGTSICHAQTYPSRPITIVVPFTAGGGTDVLARALAEALGSSLKQAVIVENVAGAGGTIGQTKVARSQGNGYTLLLGNVGTLAAATSLYRNLAYDVLQDFDPIASVGDVPQVLTVKAGFANSYEEFVQYARQHPGKVNYASAGFGSGAHLGGILLNDAIGVDATYVHYRGAAQATADLMGGVVDYSVESISTAAANYSTGKVKGLAILGVKRASVLPNVPAATETKYPVQYDLWNMLLVPKRTPKAVVGQLNAAVSRAFQDPKLIATFSKLGISIPSEDHRSVEGASKLLRSEVTRWRDLLQRVNIQPQALN